MGSAKDLLFAGIGVIVWIALVVWVFPKLGVPT